MVLFLIHSASLATWKALQAATTSTVQTQDRRTHKDQTSNADLQDRPR